MWGPEKNFPLTIVNSPKGCCSVHTAHAHIATSPHRLTDDLGKSPGSPPRVPISAQEHPPTAGIRRTPPLSFPRPQSFTIRLTDSYESRLFRIQDHDCLRPQLWSQK